MPVKHRVTQSAHTVAGKAAALSEEQTVAIRENRVDLDPKRRPQAGS